MDLASVYRELHRSPHLAGRPGCCFLSHYLLETTMPIHPITTRIQQPCVWFLEGSSMTCSACAGQISTQTFCGQCGERFTSTPSSDAKLCTLLDGRFFIESKIASGGFGTVYRARSLETSQEVAIKVLQAQHTADPSVS